MHPNEKLITTFYSCFQQLDADGMAACYHENICFSDPAFPDLRGAEAGAMWKMLCTQAQGFELTFGDISADDIIGKAHWEAKYDFTATHRQVHNKINAKFRFQDGKIIQHHDSFNFWKWSFMALGPVGLMLGWSPMLRKKVQHQAAKGLKKFTRR
jgi:SnoaL-like protein